MDGKPADWFYVGQNLLRYWDGESWTDTYRDLAYQPRYTKPASRDPDLPVAKLRESADKRHSRATELNVGGWVGLGIAVGAVGAGLLLFVTGVLGSTGASVNATTPAPRPTATVTVTRTLTATTVGPGATVRTPTTAEYATALGDVPILIDTARESFSPGFSSAPSTHLRALAAAYTTLVGYPAPSRVADWTAVTGALRDQADRCADEWDAGHQAAAATALTSLIARNNDLVNRTNKALGLTVPTS